LQLKYYLPYRAALTGQYRFFHDTWGITARTAEVDYTHPVRKHLILDGSFRYYHQGPADFYNDLFPRANYQNFMGRDRELAAFNSYTVGAGASWLFAMPFVPALGKNSINLRVDHLMIDYSDFRNALLAGTYGAANAAHAQAREQGRLLIASEVLEEIRDSRDQSIPERLLQRAYGIAVIPDLTKVAFFAGGRRGHGVLVVRDKQGRFSNPVLITLTGGSFGWQWGVQSTDIVLVFTTAKGVEGITGGKVTLGADASVAAGPVGRQAEAATDATFRSEVYSYSRSRGVFAG